MSLVAYRRALASYVRRLLARWAFLAVLLGGVCGYFAVSFAHSWLVWPAVMALASTTVAWEMCRRLGSYRGRLVPHYRQIHFAVAATLCLAILAVLTMGMHYWPRETGVAGVGVMLLACAVGCWGVVSLPPLILVLVTTVMLGLLSTQWLKEMSESLDRPAINGALALVAVALIGWFIRWVWDFTEDDAAPVDGMRRAWDARQLDSWSKGAKQRALAAAPIGLFSGTRLRLRDRRLASALRRGPRSLAWQVRRWMVPWMEETQPLPALLDVYLLALVFGWFGLAWPTLFWGHALVLGSAMSVWSRRPLLGIESLRPVTRERFVLQAGAGMLARWLVKAAVVAGTLAVGVWRVGWAPASESWGPVGFAISFAAMQFVLLAALVWLMRFNSWWTAGGLVLAMSLGCGLLTQIWSQDLVLLRQIGISLALVASGAALLCGAYRRWLVVDLD